MILTNQAFSYPEVKLIGPVLNALSNLGSAQAALPLAAQRIFATPPGLRLYVSVVSILMIHGQNSGHKYMTLKPSPISLSFHGLQRFAMGMGTMLSCFAFGFFIGSDIHVHCAVPYPFRINPINR